MKLAGIETGKGPLPFIQYEMGRGVKEELIQEVRYLSLSKTRVATWWQFYLN